MRTLQVRQSGFTLLEIVLVLCVLGACASVLSVRFIDMRDEALTQTCAAKRAELVRAYAHAAEEARIDGARQSRTSEQMNDLAARLVVQAGGTSGTGGWADLCEVGLWDVWAECVDSDALVYRLRVRCSRHGGDSARSNESE